MQKSKLAEAAGVWTMKKLRFKLAGQCSKVEAQAAIETLIVDIIAASPLPFQEQRRLTQTMSRWRDMGDAAPLAMVTQMLVEQTASELGIAIPSTPEAAILPVDFTARAASESRV